MTFKRLLDLKKQLLEVKKNRFSLNHFSGCLTFFGYHNIENISNSYRVS
jgi:hypothetical protein